MLFSEPKIPQYSSSVDGLGISCGFSALQRAENSSISQCCDLRSVIILFQCSSASRKFLNFSAAVDAQFPSIVFQCSSASRKFLNRQCVLLSSHRAVGFSALQRAENSSIVNAGIRRRLNIEFQCSSASRKFLNREHVDIRLVSLFRFSALQRAENSSI